MTDRVREALRHFGVGVLAGAAVGALVGGLGGRIAMRISGALSKPELIGSATEAGERVGEITLVGSIFVIFTGIAAGAVGGAVYAGLRPLLDRTGRWSGLAFGAVALGLIGHSVIDPGNFDFTHFGPAIVNVSTFAVLFFLFGLLIGPVYARLHAVSRPERPGTWAAAAGIAVWFAASGALIAAVFIVLGQITEIRTGFQPPEAAAASVLIIGVVAAAAVAVITGTRSARVTAYAVLAAAVSLGLARTLLGIAEILSV